MVKPSVVKRKLVKLKQYLDELALIAQHSYEEYSENFLLRRSAERLIQLLVDVATDINTHALVDAGFPPPPDAYTSFLDVVKINLLPADFAKKIAPSAGERNIIVHEYDNIDDMIIYESISEALEMYGEYARYVEAFFVFKES